VTTTLTEALREEHRTYQPRIEDMRRLADDCTEERPTALAADLDRTLAFLDDELLPHAAAEDAVLYVAVAELLGDLRSTDTMRLDHAEIRHLVHELHLRRDELGTALAPTAVREARRLLYALHAVVSLHVRKEEEVYLRLLEPAISGAAATLLLRTMHDAVLEARGIDALAADGG
jgi:hypothetical protein